MKLHEDNQQFEGIVPTNRVAFTIQTNAKMFSILSDGIYKDKILAVIRELSCNAHDAHIAAGNKKPFRVQIPTQFNPTFAVEDEGTGIDPEKIEKIFWTYGSSTKTDSNEQIGALGLGSKSPFAYTKSSFMVVNRFNGVQHTYLCFINEHGTPDGSTVGIENTDKPNGVRVELAVRTEDIGAFREKICSFFSNWKDLPVFVGWKHINVPRPEIKTSGPGWQLLEASSNSNFSAVALMGNIAYPIDAGAVPNASEALRFISSNPFVIEFQLGELSFQASREELSYDEPTCKALEARAREVSTGILAAFRRDVEKDSANIYQLSCRARSMQKLTNAFRNADSFLESLFSDTTVFTALDGTSAPVMQLVDPKVDLKHDGHLPLTIYTLAHNLSSDNVRSMKQQLSLKMTKTILVDDPEKAGAKVEDVLTSVLPWAKPSTSPSTSPQARFGFALHSGMKVAETIMSVDLTYTLLAQPTDNVTPFMIILNNLGTSGAYVFRRCSRNLSTSRTLFVDIGDRDVFKGADFGRQLVTDMLKGTNLQGVEPVLLTEMPGFQMPKTTPATTAGTRVTHPRGSVEVRTISYSQDPHSFLSYHTPVSSSAHRFLRASPRPSTYTRVEPAKANLLFARVIDRKLSRGDKAVLDNYMSGLLSSGLLDQWAQRSPSGYAHVQVVVVNEADEKLLRTRGATLTNVSDVWNNAITESSNSTMFAELKELMLVGNFQEVLSDVSPAFAKKMAALLPSDSLFLSLLKRAELAKAEIEKQETVAKFFVVGYGGFRRSVPTKVPTLAQQFQKAYPLLNSETDLRDAAHLALYITAADIHRKQQEAAAKASEKALASILEPSVV